MVRIANVPVRDLLILLNQIGENYELVDIIIDTENRRVILNAVEDPPDESISFDEELTEDNLYDII